MTSTISKYSFLTTQVARCKSKTSPVLALSDDTPLSRYVWPTRTTVSQPSEDMGRIAAQQLLRVIEDKGQNGEMALVPFALVASLHGAAPARKRSHGR